MSDLPSHGDLSYAPPSPVDPTTGDPTALMGRRIVAWVLDLVLFLAVVIGVFAALAERVDVPEGFSLDPCDSLQEQAPDLASGCVDVGDDVFITSESDSLIQAAAAFGYLAVFVVLQGLTGGSPGKLLTGIRVVDEQGRTAGIGRSIVRTLLWAVDGAPWFVPLVGFITGVTSTGHRRVGDLAASTWVVAKRSVGSPPALSTPSFDPTAPGSWTPPPAAAPPTSWSPQPEWSPPASAEPDPTAGPAELPPPQWDQARGTYIQWDPRQLAWLQWDTIGQRWKPIDT